MTKQAIPPFMSIIVPPISQHSQEGRYQALASYQVQVMERQGRLIDDQVCELNALHRIIVALVHQNPDHELIVLDSTLDEMETEVQVRTMHDGTINASRIRTTAEYQSMDSEPVSNRYKLVAQPMVSVDDRA